VAIGATHPHHGGVARPRNRATPGGLLNRVRHVYIDPSAILLPAATGGHTADPVPAGAADPLHHLIEAGWAVVLVGDSRDDVGAVPEGVRTTPELPERLDPDEWFLTGEPHPPMGRPRGGRTVLVGPKRPPGPIPLPRFDLETRDLASAVMEILTREAMA